MARTPRNTEPDENDAPTADEIDAHYAAYEANTLDEPDAWGDLAAFRSAAARS
jgi:hypothetical protein